MKRRNRLNRDVLIGVASDLGYSEDFVNKIVNSHYKAVKQEIVDIELKDPSSFKEIVVIHLFSLIPMLGKALSVLHGINDRSLRKDGVVPIDIESFLKRDIDDYSKISGRIASKRLMYKSRNNIFNNHHNRIKSKRDEDIYNRE